MQQRKINIILFNCLILLFLTTGVALSQQNKYETLIKKGNKSFQTNVNLSEQNYRRAISVSPDSIKGQYNFSNNLYENGYYDEALLSQSEALKNAKLSIDKHQIFHNIGNILMQKKCAKKLLKHTKMH